MRWTRLQAWRGKTFQADMSVLVDDAYAASDDRNETLLTHHTNTCPPTQQHATTSCMQPRDTPTPRLFTCCGLHDNILCCTQVAGQQACRSQALEQSIAQDSTLQATCGWVSRLMRECVTVLGVLLSGANNT